MATPRPASCARRVLPAVAIAGMSGAILVQLDRPGTAGVPAAGDAAIDVAEAPATSTAPAATASTTSTTPPATAAASTARSVGAARSSAPGGAAGSSPTTPAPTTPAPSTAATAAPTTPPTAAPASACDGEPVAGPVVDTRWGPVQVSAAFDANGRLCDVRTLVYPTDHRKSVTINQRALPVLRQEALAAGNAAIDAVTGATITSDAYARSLQAILDGRA